MKQRFLRVLVLISLAAVVTAVGAVDIPTTDAQQSGSFDITGFNAPAEASVGDTVSASANFRNTGGADATVTVGYRIDGRVLNTRQVTLGAGESREISFQGSIPDLDSGTYQQTLFVEETGDERSSQIRVTRPGQAFFNVLNLRAPSQANVGGVVTAEAVVRNTGTAAGSTTLEYRIGDRVVASRSVSLEPEESVAVALQGTVPSLAAGSYRQGVFIGEGDEGQSRASSITIGARSAVFSVLRMQPPSEGAPGSSVSVTATVRNTGDASGTVDLEYRIRERVVASRSVSLDAGESRSVTLSGPVPNLARGSYQQGVFVGSSNNGLTSAFRVTGTGPSFSVTGLRAPSRASSGDRVTAEATIRNTGDERGTETIEYRIDGRTVATRDVTLNAGSRTTVTLRGEVPDRSSGTYRQGIFVEGTNRGVSANLVIRDEDDARFDVYDLRAPSQVEENEEVTVRATVENTGDETGSTRLEYRVDGEVVDSRSVELRPGRSTTVSFEGSVPDIGTGTYRQGVFVGTTNRGQTSLLRIAAQTRFRLTDFEAPTSATVGSSVSARATVRNDGNSRATRTVEYRIGNNIVASEEVRVGARSSRTVSLSGTVPSVTPGIYQQGVFVDGSALRRSVEVREQRTPQAAFEIEDVDAPSQAAAGDRIDVVATVRNTGDASGSTALEYRVDDNIVSTKRVTLDAGSSDEVEFDIVVPDLSPGDYDQGVFVGDTNNGETTGLEITEAEEPDSGDSTDGGGDGDGAGDADGGGDGDGEETPGFTVVAGVLALLTAALVSRLGRKSGGKR